MLAAVDDRMPIVLDRILPGPWEAASAVVGLLIFVGLAVLAARDMSARGERGWLYGLLIVFVFPVGLVVWIVQASRIPRQDAGQDASAAPRN